jgi:hypothetical protein
VANEGVRGDRIPRRRCPIPLATVRVSGVKILVAGFKPVVPEYSAGAPGLVRVEGLAQVAALVRARRRRMMNLEAARRLGARTAYRRPPRPRSPVWRPGLARGRLRLPCPQGYGRDAKLRRLPGAR